jgi:hypothetical protein
VTDDKTAELLAAVRAVESGERAAASFFAEPEPPRAAARAPRPAAAPHPQQGSGPPPGAGQEAGGPATVPESLRALLREAGAPEALATRLLQALGERAEEVLRADPWQLLAAPGVRPEQADGFARALLGAQSQPGDERRGQALVTWLLERAALAGHTVLEPGALAKELAGHGVPRPDEAVRGAVDAGAVLIFEDRLDAAPGGGVESGAPPRAASAAEPGGEAAVAGTGEEEPVTLLVGLDRYALAEESLADGLARLISTFTPPRAAAGDETAPRTEARSGAEARAEAPSEAEAGSGVEVGAEAGSEAEAEAGGEARSESGDAPPRPTAAAWEAAAQASPTSCAAELIRAAAGHGLVAHTGGEAARAEPAALVAAARRLGLRAYAAAHAPEGRDRLASLIASGSPQESPAAPDVPAPHGAGHGSGAGSAPDGSPDGAAVTVAGLLAGREGPPRDEDGTWALDLLAVCDAPQLDAEDAAALAESLPDGARLVLSGDPGLLGPAGPGQVFVDVLAARACPHLASRTPDPGPLGELVSGIGIGELNQVEAPGKEVVIVPVRDAGEAVHRTVQLVADSVPRAIGVPSGRTQVVTPGHGGAAGTRALNAALKERLNPGQGRFAGFDPGDRVAHSPAPGRTALGTVVSGGDEGLRIEYENTGTSVVVAPPHVAGTVRHGWAVTAHQAVGTRWPAAVAVLPGDATDALTREWVYTAFSRAERHLSVVHGAAEALPQAVASRSAPKRGTRLRPLLTAAIREAVTPPSAPAAGTAAGTADQSPAT